MGVRDVSFSIFSLFKKLMSFCFVSADNRTAPVSNFYYGDEFNMEKRRKIIVLLAISMTLEIQQIVLIKTY